MIKRIINIFKNLFGNKKTEYPASRIISAMAGGVPFRHKGCRTEVARYFGVRDLAGYSYVRSGDWNVLGVRPTVESIRGRNRYKCPDCGRTFSICSEFIEEIREK